MKFYIKEQASWACIISVCAACSSVYRTDVIDKEGHFRETVTKLKSTRYTCEKCETILIRDSASHVLLSKEIIWYDCRGAYSEVVNREKWVLQNNKLVLSND